MATENVVVEITIEQEIENNNKKHEANIEKLESIISELKNMLIEEKKLCKDTGKLMRKAHATKKKKLKNTDPNKKNSFSEKYVLSNELCELLGFESGKIDIRPNVTSFISDYVKDNKLQNDSNGKLFDLKKPGSVKLAKLFGINPQDENIPDVGYLNLQTYLKNHLNKIPKEEKTEASGETETKQKKQKKKSEEPVEKQETPASEPEAESDSSEKKKKRRQKAVAASE